MNLERDVWPFLYPQEASRTPATSDTTSNAKEIGYHYPCQPYMCVCTSFSELQHSIILKQANR